LTCAVVGLTLTCIGVLIVTMAEADFVGSASEVAVTIT
jgi:hypothetical protein